MRKSGCNFFAFLTIFISCGGNSGSIIPRGERVNWSYTRPEKKKELISVPKLSFNDVKKTIDIRISDDSTLIGAWDSYRGAQELISKEGNLYYYYYYYNGNEDSVKRIWISDCSYEEGILQSKRIIKETCNQQSYSYYAISSEDSSLMEFLAENDSLHEVYKKIDYARKPIEEKKAKYRLYKERDTLTVSWYAEFGDISWERIIKKGDTYYIMVISESSYEVNTLFASTHPLGIRLDIAPRNEAMAEWLKKNNIYHVLSKDSSLLYTFNSMRGKEDTTILKKLKNYPYNTWVDEHLFEQPGNGEPWR